MEHTYSIIVDSPAFNLAWIGVNRATYGKQCSCGVLSSVHHDSIELAHREPMHVHALNTNRRIKAPVFDGRIIERF
jgi:hypothetical protein